MYYLYYAGMACDQKGTEQIGLAISEDGIHFQKVKQDGLILEKDERLIWKGLRVCNPTVLYHQNQFIMFYQGISSEEPHHTSIGRATSQNGIDFTCQDTPCLSWEAIKGIVPELDETKTIGLIEPSVILEDETYKMWFIYAQGDYERGNALYYAESHDGERWKISERRILTGSQFGNCNLHYPHIISSNGLYEMWFTLRNIINGVFGIFRMTSRNGIEWENLHQILPQFLGGFLLNPKNAVAVNWYPQPVGGTGLIPRAYTKICVTLPVKGINFINAIYMKCFPGIKNYYGYAHPHIMERTPDLRIMYLHNYHKGKSKGLWMDISRCEMKADWVTNIQTVLTPSNGHHQWDAYFVADPYVLQI